MEETQALEPWALRSDTVAILSPPADEDAGGGAQKPQEVQAEHVVFAIRGCKPEFVARRVIEKNRTRGCTRKVMFVRTGEDNGIKAVHSALGKTE
jgi:hypothetical protein